MTKTYITTMPDKAGAFLIASEIVSSYGGNITRVSYNKVIDSNTLFLDVQGEEEIIGKITEELKALGYLLDNKHMIKNKVILMEFKLLDVPGSVKPVLEIINHYEINISYISSQENGTEYQNFRMGLVIEKPRVIKRFLDEISRLCKVRILEYDITEKMLDNTVFYLGFADAMTTLFKLNHDQTNEVIINSNKIMQMLDARNENPYKTFEYIRKFANYIYNRKGAKFNPIFSHRKLSEEVTLHLIEPPYGSNTFILESGSDLLFIDGGFPCYLGEMQIILNNYFPDFNKRKKRLVLTHSDIDHTGLIPLFDEVLVSARSYENFWLENNGEINFREQNAAHAPYARLSRVITGYRPVDLGKLKIIGKKNDEMLLSGIGEIAFGDMLLEVLEGDGGHVQGEIILVCEDRNIVFSGDLLVNIKGFSKDQADFNILAPYLMTSVNVDSAKASQIRELISSSYGDFLVCCGHGTFMENGS